MQQIHLHLVSDSTGDTLNQVAKAAFAQFADVEVIKHNWPMIRTARHMENIIPELEEHPGIVMFTLVNRDMEDVLVVACEKNKWKYVSVLRGIIRQIGSILGEKGTRIAGLQHRMDDEYFDRIAAMEYTMAHDDGQIPDGLHHADIVVVGVSRTSKTPTCIYLANKGYKAANIPLVPNCPLPDDLENIKDTFVVGLVHGVDHLVQIRRNRLNSLQESNITSYVDTESVKNEIREARRLFSKMGWPVIDTTRKSIEETAVAIQKLKQKYDEERGLISAE
jgi:regulator of PEP synthase PpsR (kinase-PPPase family)